MFTPAAPSAVPRFPTTPGASSFSHDDDVALRAPPRRGSRPPGRCAPRACRRPCRRRSSRRPRRAPRTRHEARPVVRLGGADLPHVDAAVLRDGGRVHLVHRGVEEVAQQADERAGRERPHRAPSASSPATSTATSVGPLRRELRRERRRASPRAAGRARAGPGPPSAGPGTLTAFFTTPSRRYATSCSATRDRHGGLGLLGRGADVRRADEVVQREERVVRRGRLLLEDVERGAAEVAGRERVGERRARPRSRRGRSSRGSRPSSSSRASPRRRGGASGR